MLILRAVFGIFKRLFIRLFFFPLYAMLAIPWLMVFVVDRDLEFQQQVFKPIAYLAGKPGVESLNEGDLAQAVLILFISLDILLEIFKFIRGKHHKTEPKVSLRRRMYIQWVLSLTGWIVLGLSQYSKQGLTATMGFAAIGIITCAFFWMEYSFKEGFSRIKF